MSARRSVRLLFALLGGALAWTLHLFASYAVVAVGCLHGWSGARPTLAAVTFAALGLALSAGIVAVRSGSDDRLLGPETGAATERFTLGLGVRLSALFGFLILLGGLVPFLAPLCAATQ